MIKKLSLGLVLLVLMAVSGGTAIYAGSEDQTEALLALTNATLIDGAGAAPVTNAVIIIQDGKIFKTGRQSAIAIPKNARVIDLKGATILPGFINTHVHYAFDPEKLTAWAYAGVTTVRDLAIMNGKPLAENLAMRAKWLKQVEYARLLTVGPGLTVPNGYGTMPVNSPEDARQKVNQLIDNGVDAIKLTMEDGYAGKTGMPKLSPKELAAIIHTAHQRGMKVVAHITQEMFLEVVLDAGADQIAHLCYDWLRDSVIKRMVKRKVFLIPTFTVFRGYMTSMDTLIDNLSRYVAAGGQVALGDDYGGGPGKFELGMPIYELECMQKAKMTPMQIILACTKNAAYICGVEQTLGTLEAGKVADVLVITGDPLQDLNNLRKVRMVIKEGTIIRDISPEKQDLKSER